ncbi:MAG: serine hydrolase, partial [Bacillota bacterium]
GRSLRGFNRPIDAKFGPDGSLYVVDFGVFEWNDRTPRAVRGTGVVWRIFRQRSEYHEFVCATMAKLEAARTRPWSPDYGPLQARLRAYLSAQPEKWGLYFKDLASGKAFGVNEYVEIPAASTVKVAVVLYASHLVAEGKLSWDEQLTYYAQRDWRGGAGTLQFTAKDGDSFTIRELAEKAIRDSDNIAWKMLERRLGKQNIINFMWSIGGENVYPGGQNISTPKDNATYMEAALNFAKQNRDGEKLIFDLAHTVWNTGLNRYITEVPVAHKEGDVTGVADDVGIVFADFPYILSIMSEGHADVEAGFEKIGEISRLVYDYQRSLSQGEAVVMAAAIAKNR